MSDWAARPRKPGFLKIVMVAAGVVGAIGALFTGAVLASTAVLPGPYFVNGRPVSFDEFMAFAVPALGSYFVLSVTAMVLSRGLKNDRLWTRPALLTLASCMVVVPLLLAYVSGLDLRSVMPGVLMCIVMLVVLWWQLYYDDDIIAYYAAVQERERGQGRG
jgi:hypothetical protein